jgi:hypothetical protein
MGHHAQSGVRRETGLSRLDQIEGRLDEVVALLENMIAKTSDPARPPSHMAATFTPSSATSKPDAEIIRPTGFPKARARIAREAIRRRRKREEYFPSGLFADPGWDIMLDLYAAHYEGESVSVSSLCIAAAVPQTTALRWITMMTNEGWLLRWNDPTDGRRAYLKLSDKARSRLDSYFDDLPY